MADIPDLTQPVLEKIIERLQSSIVDARSLQLKMLEQLLSMAVLQAREDERDLEKDPESRHLNAA